MVQPIYEASTLPLSLQLEVRDRIAFREYTHHRSEEGIELSCYHFSNICDKSINIHFMGNEYLTISLTGYWKNVVIW